MVPLNASFSKCRKKNIMAMLDAETFQDGADLEHTNRQPLNANFCRLEYRTGTPTTRLESVRLFYCFRSVRDNVNRICDRGGSLKS